VEGVDVRTARAPRCTHAEQRDARSAPSGAPRGKKRRALLALLAGFAALAPACASAPSLAGTWSDPDGTTPLPESVGGGDLNIASVLVLAEGGTMPTFDLHMELEFMGLMDVIDAQGTYVASGPNLTLTFTGFDIDPASGNAEMTIDGVPCITQTGFGGATVCFPSPQSHPYRVDGSTLTITIDGCRPRRWRRSRGGTDPRAAHFSYTRNRRCERARAW
jgi:hypothetical protein